MPMLNIAYITCRKECQIDWFLDSLNLQVRDGDEIRIIIVDAFHDERDGQFISKLFNHTLGNFITRTGQKPNVWNGNHRLTKENWFGASGFRNTALCLSMDGYVSYCDDLSVLGPHWLQSVRESMAGNYIVLGTYEKHNAMIVEGGKLVYSKPYSFDARFNHAVGDVHSCGGDWLYGCSLAGPVQAFLDVNGFPEALCDGLGGEDYCMGIAIGNTGKYSFRFDKRMKTIESEELHYVGDKFKKSDFGISPNDKSHAALNTAKQSKWFPQYLGDGFETISDLRQHVLNGGEFPIRKHPEHEWFLGTALKDL